MALLQEKILEIFEDLKANVDKENGIILEADAVNKKKNLN